MTTELPRAGETVICPKCGGRAQLPADRCPHCRRHLYVKCEECHAVNFRAREQCRECGARLKHAIPSAGPRIHRHVWPACWSADRRRRWLVPVQVALFVATVTLASYATIKVVEYRQRPPRLEPPEVCLLDNGKLTRSEDAWKR